MSIAFTRRDFLVRAALVPVGILARHPPKRPPVHVYKSASCGCCKQWVEHIQKAGFTVTVQDTENLDGIKHDLGVPGALASCHTAVVGPYIIEGHVPADLIDRMLAERTQARGLAVPGMPQSAPGMDVPDAKDHYDVMMFTAGGKTAVFAKR